MAGLAGGLYVYTQQFFAPGSSSVQFAVLLLAGMTIGGMGTITGPLIGAVATTMERVFGLFPSCASTRPATRASCPAASSRWSPSARR
jgi:branched-chain amino acid transport system permease protein